MKFFFKRLIIFALPIVVVLTTVEYFLRHIPNDYSYKSKYLENNSKNIEVLFLGSSHIYFGINPEYTKLNGFNAANTSQSINLDWDIFSKYQNWSKLKYIVIPVDYIALYTQLNNNLDSWRLKNYNLYFDMSKTFKPSNYSEILNGKFSTNVERLNKYYLDNGKSNIECNLLGYGISYNHTKKLDLKTTSAEAAERHKVDINSKQAISNYIANSKAIDNFLEYGKKNNIKIVFLSTPVSKYYFDKTANDNQLSNTINFIEKRVATNKGYCSYINLMQAPGFVDNDFYDGDHLNDYGAKKLTQQLNSILK